MRRTTEDHALPEFSLLGGPLHWLGTQLGWVKEGTKTLRLGIALGSIAWGVLVVLTLIQGVGSKVFSLGVIGVHVRLLIAMPLFFLCETWVAPRMTEFVRNLVSSDLLPKVELPALASLVRQTNRLKDSWLFEGIILVAVFIIPWFDPVIATLGTTGNGTVILNAAGGKLTYLTAWYLGFCLPLFRFLLLRWLWHLGVWWFFLWRLERLKLQLIPTHPDGVAGLGYLEVVHEHFAPLVLAISAVFSASFAEGIFTKTMTFESLYLLIPLILVLYALLFLGPLFIFTRKLWHGWATGWSEYMNMSFRYVRAFDRKWVRNEKATGESQLGTSDLQSLADLTNSVRVVREMQWVPISRRILVELTAAAIVPLLPLVLTQYPFSVLVIRLIEMLTGQ